LHIYSQYITNISKAHGTKTKPKAKEKTQKRKTIYTVLVYPKLDIIKPCRYSGRAISGLSSELV